MTKTDHDLSFMEMTWGGLDFKHINLVAMHTSSCVVLIYYFFHCISNEPHCSNLFKIGPLSPFGRHPSSLAWSSAFTSALVPGSCFAPQSVSHSAARGTLVNT